MLRKIESEVMQISLPNYEDYEPRAELDQGDLSSPVQALADAALLVLVFSALAIVLIGMLLGPITGLIAPEL
ncbi:MAG TPA: hypothetical protein VHB99_10845 [Pirellulales bacterium]|nr:hypothetical protein [Pirellulales bacterium]